MLIFLGVCIVIIVAIFIMLCVMALSGDYDERTQRYYEEEIKRKLEEKYGKNDDLSNL